MFKINNDKDTALFTQKQIKLNENYMLHNIRKYLVCNELTVTFAYVKFKNKKVMTKFIDKTEKTITRKTMFEKILLSDFEVEETKDLPSCYEFVEFLGHDKYYGDVFKCFDKDPNNFTLFFGVKGSEFDEQ